MSLAANAPRAFVIRHIDTDAIVSRRFLTLMAATLKSWKMGGNADGLDHDVVGLDEDGKAWFLERTGETLELQTSPSPETVRSPDELDLRTSPGTEGSN